MDIGHSRKYLTISERDQEWGIAVNTVGSTNIPAGFDHYPPKGNPEDFDFDVTKGRILDSYQLIYISHGKGKFFIAPDKSIAIVPGTLIFIRPGVWHSYTPDKSFGWQEYWIGITGDFMSHRATNRFFSSPTNTYNIGVREDIIDLYIRAIEIAEEEKIFCQQALAGIANLILGLTLYYDRNAHFKDDELLSRIQKAKAIIRENLLSDITPEQIAERVNMSYSWFRKSFKDYMNMSPSTYIQELKLQKARDMLANTNMTIKEISFSLNYDNVSYFSTIFKKHVRYTPKEYRETYSTYRSPTPHTNTHNHETEN